jgi:hypothetical protein
MGGSGDVWGKGTVLFEGKFVTAIEFGLSPEPALVTRTLQRIIACGEWLAGTGLHRSVTASVAIGWLECAWLGLSNTRY